MGGEDVDRAADRPCQVRRERRRAVGCLGAVDAQQNSHLGLLVPYEHAPRSDTLPPGRWMVMTARHVVGVARRERPEATHHQHSRESELLIPAGTDRVCPAAPVANPCQRAQGSGRRSRARADAPKREGAAGASARRAALLGPRQAPPRISGAASGSRVPAPAPGGSSSRSSFSQACSPVSWCRHARQDPLDPRHQRHQRLLRDDRTAWLDPVGGVRNSDSRQDAS